LKQQVQKSSFTEIPKTIYSHTIKIGVNMKYQKPKNRGFEQKAVVFRLTETETLDPPSFLKIGLHL